MEIMRCIVTYVGDITKKLNASGSTCPYRLTPDGNTEQMVECFRGMGSEGIKVEALAKTIEPVIIQDCLQNGAVIGCRWALAEFS